MGPEGFAENTMKLSELIGQDQIIEELKAKDKQGVLEELAGVLCRMDPSLDKGALLRVLLERERLGTTGIGEGVAIPHGKLNVIARPMVSFGRSRRGVDFESLDGEPTHLIFLLVAPENSSGVHLQVLARIAKLLRNSTFRKRLMEAAGQEELYRTIVETDEEP